MKKTNYIIIVVLFLLNVTYSQTAEEILSKYTQATGGQVRWDNVTSMKVTGTARLISQHMELPYTRAWVKKGKHITVLKVNGMNYVDAAFNGDIAWGSNQQMVPEEKNVDDTKNIAGTLKEYPYPAHNWKEKGFTVTLMGKVHINGRKTYKIKLIKNPKYEGGKEIENSTINYIDSEKFVMVLTESQVTSGPNKGKIMKAYLSDYREVDGLLYPFISTMSYGNEDVFQIIQTEKVEFNIKLEDSLFNKPSS